MSMTSRPHTSLAAALALGLGAAALLVPEAARANDAIFPASTPAAAAKVSWSNGFFRIEGQPAFLRSGEIHYARVPRELWRDRILRAKRAGLNTIQTYVFWNAHEPKEGTFDFDGDLDLDAWLSLVEELGMYSVVRPGPYNCAEWESGGIPAWLTVKPGMQIRTSYPDYLAAADSYYEHVLPILAKHQIHRGGSMVMMQIENELFNGGWGTEGNAYLQHLYDKARGLGIEIPVFYSGLHHSNDPAGTTPFGARDVPWYSTEFWTGWFDFGGEPTADDVLRLARGTWKILEFGGGGYDYYVVHGGTNFGYSSDDELPTSYDYRAPIGEEGQLHKSYPEMKRAAMFAGAFESVLATAHDGGGQASPQVAAGLASYVRAGDTGTVVFVDNAGTSNVDTRLKLASPALDLPESGGNLTVAAGEIRPVVVGAKWTANATFDVITAGVLGRFAIGGTEHMVVYGRSDETGEIAVRYAAAPSTTPQAPWTWDAASSRAHVDFTYPTGDDSTLLTIDSGDGASLVIHVMSTDLANRTWWTGDSLVVGPAYVDDTMALDFPLAGGTATLVSAAGTKTLSAPPFSAPTPPAITGWVRREATAEAQPAFDDAAWSSSASPMPMSAYDDFQNGYGWYRTKVHVDPGASPELFVAGVADRAVAFVDGAPAGDASQLAIPAGDHVVAVLASQFGRFKLVGTEGSVGGAGYKGLWGPAVLGDARSTLSSFRASINGADSSAAGTYASPTFDDSTWTVVSPGPDTMGSQVTYAWYRASFDLASAGGAYDLLLGGADDHAWVYVNGTLVGTHDDWRTTALFDIGANVVSGHNVVAICVKNDDGAGGLSAPVTILQARAGGGPWKFHGGVGGLDESAVLGRVNNWAAFLGAPWSTGAPTAGTPQLYRADFADPRPDPSHARATVGVRTRGLAAGSVWVNGRNLGLYDGEVVLYVPEPWLRATNTIVVYDAQGRAPDRVALEYFEVQSVNGDLVPPPPPDAGPPPPTDGGGAPSDASIPMTDGSVASTDGSANGGANGAGGGDAGGCGCEVGPGVGADGAGAALVAIAWLARAVRARRRRDVRRDDEG